MRCPKCQSLEIEKLDVVDIIDQVDEDQHAKYYEAIFEAIFEAQCLNCGTIFTYQDSYREVK